MPPPIDFRRLYDSEFSYVWKALQRMGLRGPDLQDLTQDVFVTAYRRWATFDPSRPVRPWLFGIAYRLLVDFRRRLNNRHEHEPIGEDQQVSDGTPEDSVAASQAKDLAVRILERMSLDQRAVFVMFELEGHSMPEIAEALEVPLNTAYSRLRLARQQFNQAVQRLNEEDRS